MSKFIPLNQEVRTHISTREAAFHLNRRDQTLRKWASLGVGLVEPIHVGNRLAWPVREIKKILGLDA